MHWRTGRRSENVEDRRDDAGSSGDEFDGRRLPVRMGRGAGVGGGLGTIVLLLVGLYFGVDLTAFLGGGSPQLDTGGGQLQLPSPPKPPPHAGGLQAPGAGAKPDELKDFISVVLADTEDTWGEIFRQGKQRYQEPKLVLFSGEVRSACGFAEAAMGPFYCPGDHKVYIDLSFYDELRGKFGAPGDFAQAYVIAHEIGHHVQNLLGISDQVEEAKRGRGKAAANQLSVRLELQADCFAGVWANRADQARGILEAGDAEEALKAASAIGDDRLQKQTRGYVTPDSFTHGSSAQRVAWFRRGLEKGDVNACDTFSAKNL
ncbi:MAG: neutral zinc metallopeptidase [Chromatiaceae bacterium]|nr:neutral zinc metallopeptidase [Chromatiaceae bacterium]